MISFYNFYNSLDLSDRQSIFRIILLMVAASIVELLGIIILSDYFFAESSLEYGIYISILIIFLASMVQIYLTKIALKKMSFIGLMIPKGALSSGRYQYKNKYSLSEEVVGEAQRANDYVLLPMTMSLARLPLVIVVVFYAFWMIPELIYMAIPVITTTSFGLFYLLKTLGKTADRLSSKGSRARAKAAEDIVKACQIQRDTTRLSRQFDLATAAYSEGRALTTATSLSIRPLIEISFLVSIALIGIFFEGIDSINSSVIMTLGVGMVKILPNVQNIISGVMVAEANKSSLDKLLKVSRL
jgi:hypothetical protein